MTSKTYTRFVKRWEEVTDLPPQTLGPLTKPYKNLSKRLKVMPFPWLLMVSALLIVALYLVIGPAITFLVTLLQRGF